MDISRHFQLCPDRPDILEYVWTGRTGESYFLMDYDVSKTITVSEISTIMRKLFRSFLGQIGYFLSFVLFSE
jgi:hypothetical protein